MIFYEKSHTPNYTKIVTKLPHNVHMLIAQECIYSKLLHINILQDGTLFEDFYSFVN